MIETQPINITRASLAHVPQLAPLFDAYRQFYRQTSDVDTATRYLTERLQHDEATIFLALAEGAAIGFTLLYPTFSSVSLKRLWVLNDLYVVPALRRHGVGAALMERARQHAVETQARGLVLQTATDNPAQHLYEHMGWKRDNAFYHYYLYL